MRVLMIAPQPFLEPRGTPISVYQRARGLAVLGHTVHLVTYHIGQEVRIPGVRIFRIPRVPFVKEVRVGPSICKALLDLLLFGKAISLLAKQRYDVIHSHEEAAFFSAFLAWTFHTRHLYDMHSSLPRQLANFNFGNVWPLVKLFELFERRVVRSCDAVITIGSDLEQYVLQLHPTVKQVMIENMSVHRADDCDPQMVQQLAERLGLLGKFPIVYTGTFERYQGVDLLVGSAAIVCARHPEAAFVLVGGKPHQVEHWRAEVRRQGLQDRVLFVGTVPLDEVGLYAGLAKLLVSPRVAGTSVPLKIYTYLHLGKPIVATRLPAHTLVLDDETSVLVEPTREAFAAGISRLIQEPELRERLGARARLWAQERYGPEAYLGKLNHVCQIIQADASGISFAHR